MAAKYGQTAVVETLLERCNNVDVEGRNSLTPLHIATQYNRKQVVFMLLSHHASTQRHAKVQNKYFTISNINFRYDNTPPVTKLFTEADVCFC